MPSSSEHVHGYIWHGQHSVSRPDPAVQQTNMYDMEQEHLRYAHPMPSAAQMLNHRLRRSGMEAADVAVEQPHALLVFAPSAMRALATRARLDAAEPADVPVLPLQARAGLAMLVTLHHRESSQHGVRRMHRMQTGHPAVRLSTNKICMEARA